MQRIQQSLEVAQTPREPSVTPRGGSTRVRMVPRNPWLDRETSHERLVREQSSAVGESEHPNANGADRTCSTGSPTLCSACTVYLTGV